MSDELPKANWLASVLLRLPVVNYASRCLAQERHGELGLLAANFVMTIVLAVAVWGWPVLTIFTTAATFLILAMLVAITRG